MTSDHGRDGGDSEAALADAGLTEAALDEAALVRAAQADPAAFAPLYHRYRDRLYAYLRTRTRSAEDAADLTQQVFVQALAALPRFRMQQVTIAAWLVRIAHNLVATYHQRARSTIAWDLLPEALHPLADDLDDQVDRREALAWLRTALQACPPAAREVLALHFAARLTIAETAAVVGKSEAAVKKQLTRTIHALKEQYHDPA
jgi:RNA polymerase sigma-70 factor (ECF subfamily)